jgi:hypothetical protein
MVFATSLDLFMPPAAESVNNKIQIKKMDAAPRLAAPFANTAPNPPEPPRIIASSILAPLKKVGVVNLSSYPVPVAPNPPSYRL